MHLGVNFLRFLSCFFNSISSHNIIHSRYISVRNFGSDCTHLSACVDQGRAPGRLQAKRLLFLAEIALLPSLRAITKAPIPGCQIFKKTLGCCLKAVKKIEKSHGIYLILILFVLRNETYCFRKKRNIFTSNRPSARLNKAKQS